MTLTFLKMILTFFIFILKSNQIKNRKNISHEMRFLIRFNPGIIYFNYIFCNIATEKVD